MMSGDKIVIKKRTLFWTLILVVFLIWLFWPVEEQNINNYAPNNVNDLFYSISELHWDHMPLTYTIKDNANCGNLQMNKMLEAIQILENKTEYIKFVESNESDSDLTIQCIDWGEIRDSYLSEIDRLKRVKLNCMNLTYGGRKESLSTYEEGILNKSDNLFVNASKKYANATTIWSVCYINVSDINFSNIQTYGINDWRDIANNVLGDARPIVYGNLIENATINLYAPEYGWSVCTNFPAKEMHELLHIFGFGHIAEPGSGAFADEIYTYYYGSDIMSAYIQCTLQKEIQEKYTLCLDYIYSNGKKGFCSSDVYFIY